MNNQEVVPVLQECKQMLDVLASEVSEPSEQEKNDYQQCEASLPADLRTLIQEAKEMKWPFVPERWQYKQAVGPEDKTNLQDLINPRLHELLVFLKASIRVADSDTAAAIVFLIDRFLYWADASTRLLSVAKALHKLWPSTPIAPQVVIRQARISINSGKLQKAEYILSSLISNNGATGTWHYSEESDRVLVQSVCIQIRGQILQKLGMWYEAAELIWTSIVGFFALTIPDKKGAATSLGALADIFISMSEEDYHRFKKNSHVGLSLLEEFDHRLLSAAEACKLAATYSLYTPLFVLTNLNIRGMCLLSYSLSKECPAEKKTYYLSEAKESFEIGLLTKKRGDQVTSKQELHSFVKAAFCLANVHKWLNSEAGPNKEVNELCKDAMEKLGRYNMLSDELDKGILASKVMSLVDLIKGHLKVHQFPNSDERAFVPDKYSTCVDKNIVIGKVSFANLLDMYSQHHNSVCKAFDVACRKHFTMNDGMKSGACVTALNTNTISSLDNSSSQSSSEQSDEKSRRRRLFRSDAVRYSVDEDRSKQLSSLHRDSHGSSLSNSFSWECIPEHNEKGPQVISLSSSVTSDNVLGENNVADEIHIQSLSIQDKSNPQSKDHLLIKTPDEEEMSKQTDHINIVTTGSKCSETSASSNVVTRPSSAKGYSTCSDDGSFEFLELTGEMRSANKSSKPITAIDEYPAFKVNTAEERSHHENVAVEKKYTVEGVSSTLQESMADPSRSLGGLVEQSLHYGINIADETQDITDELPISLQKTIMVPASQSGSIVGSRSNFGKYFEDETQDTTDESPIDLQKIIMTHPDLSGGDKGPRMHGGVDVECKTQDTTEDLPNTHSSRQTSVDHSSGVLRQTLFCGIHAEDETKDYTDESSFGVYDFVPAHAVSSDVADEQRVLYATDLLGETEVPTGESGCIEGINIQDETNVTTDNVPVEMYTPAAVAPGQSAVHSKASGSSSEDKSLATEDILEKQFLSHQWSVEEKAPLGQRSSLIASLSSSGSSKAATSFDEPCKAEADDKANNSLSSSHSSSSWHKVGQFSGSFSESQLSLNSSASSFVHIHKHRDQINEARSLGVTDYECLLSGVRHEWLLQRLEKTGVFKFKHSEKTCNALLLKFSKKSELWTAQETLVHFGKKVHVDKEGKQRDAFWISFLHQDETLGRYVGKAYKKNKELLYHFSDVERQMTAQYYVTEFNKRLYERNIPTQIFYIPSSVLLIMEDGAISSCVSVEPYILGTFRKFTNNTEIVRMQYNATKYGLAFGHFAYEFSQFSDIVVDLQGWVTGSQKGDALIYLTDPQIHSSNDVPGATCINFGYEGIYMFFSSQHSECNEICHSLSLTRPDIKELEKYSKKRTHRSRQHH
ncbi:alpha-protein kinase 1 [Hyperolius riggenbachi]|uniref:alpha-protein kinase 1 n=1 Tax=Hyperolius riggenbachi TaxID=752182 RepID=UPI0035A38697